MGGVRAGGEKESFPGGVAVVKSVKCSHRKYLIQFMNQFVIKLGIKVPQFSKRLLRILADFSRS